MVSYKYVYTNLRNKWIIFKNVVWLHFPSLAFSGFIFFYFLCRLSNGAIYFKFLPPGGVFIYFQINLIAPNLISALSLPHTHIHTHRHRVGINMQQQTDGKRRGTGQGVGQFDGVVLPLGRWVARSFWCAQAGSRQQEQEQFIIRMTSSRKQSFCHLLLCC